MHCCPLCETSARVIKTRHAVTGVRKQRLKCKSKTCGHRWTIWQAPEGPPPEPKAPSHCCSLCKARARVIEVRRTSDGGRRRRLACQSETCGYRWTVWHGPEGLSLEVGTPLRVGCPEPPPGGATARKRPPLTDEELLLLLERRDLNNAQMGRILDLNQELVRKARRGLTYADRLPHIARWGATRNPLTDDQLLLLLERKDLNNVQVGKILDRSYELVRQARCGLVYADRLPHVARWTRTGLNQLRSCEQCAQWFNNAPWPGYCLLGHPDPEEDGLHVAADCIDFLDLKTASAAPSPAAAAR